jgi:hypothetical protein
MAQQKNSQIEWEKEELKRVQAQILNALNNAYKEAIEGLVYIRDNRLYAHEYPSFEAYCKAIFGKTSRCLNYQLKAAQMSDILIEIGIERHKPTERCLRPLSRLEELEEKLGSEKVTQLKIEAYVEAKGKAIKHPPGTKVSNVVERILAAHAERGQYQNPYNPGDIVVLKKSDLPQNKPYVGCWGVVTRVAGRLCWLKVWDSTLLETKPECLEPEQDLLWEKAQAVMGRINQLTQTGRFDKEPAAWFFLEQLGRSKHPSLLTSLEETMLSSIEAILIGSVEQTKHGFLAHAS